MTLHLLALEFGPVGEFIAAARKTRDLWFASWMFSEVAKAAARAIVKDCGIDALIVPAPKDKTDLEEGTEFTVGDEILALVQHPAEIASSAKQAAHGRWIKFAMEAFRAARNDIEEKVWDAQIKPVLGADFAGEVIEVYAAWTPLSGDYSAARARVKRLLAGRTNCRNFPPPAQAWPGVPKSSLDGQRESVLRKIDAAKHEKRNQRLRLTTGEQLDAPGLTKRLAGQTDDSDDSPRTYPSTARLAADPWLRGAEPDALKDLRTACEQLGPRFLSRIDERYSQYRDFLFEGAIVYENRHHELAEENSEYQGEDKVKLRDAIEAQRRKLDPVKEALDRMALDEPQPYYGILVADGDGVGAALQRVHDPDAHRQFSQQLSTFADDAKEIIKKHWGVAVFVGGDDIVALLPVNRAVLCADELRQKFANCLKTDAAQPPSQAITLSAGLAFGHFLEPLEEVLEAAKSAEHHAKNDAPPRDALAVHYASRGGAPITVRKQWRTGLADHLHHWARLLRRGVLPDKLAYDLRNLAREYPSKMPDKLIKSERDKIGWPDNKTLTEALQKDVFRLIARKSKESRAELQPLVNSLQEPQDVIDLANTIIIARLIAHAMDQAKEPL